MAAVRNTCPSLAEVTPYLWRCGRCVLAPARLQANLVFVVVLQARIGKIALAAAF